MGRRLERKRRSGAVGNIIVNAHRKGIGTLEHHAYILAQSRKVGALRINILAADLDGALHAAALDEIVHAVERL